MWKQLDRSVECLCGGSYGEPPFSCLRCRVTTPSGRLNYRLYRRPPTHAERQDYRMGTFLSERAYRMVMWAETAEMWQRVKQTGSAKGRRWLPTELVIGR